jgi:phenylalanyl-tRNA synthetase beta subunit
MSEADALALSFDTKTMLEVKNPVQPENKYMRPSLFAGLAKLVAKNSSFGLISAFEIGQVFTKTTEHTNLAVMIASGNQKDAERFIDSVTKVIPEVSFNLVDQGKFKYKFRKKFVYFSEVEISVLNKYQKNTNIATPKSDIVYRQVSKYPSMTRDIAVVVDSNIKANDIIGEIYNTSDLVNRVELFDEFKSDKLGASKKSLAFHLDLQDLNKTLTDMEADNEVKNIVSRLKDKFDAVLRS